jgi:hypothetical protein
VLPGALASNNQTKLPYGTIYPQLKAGAAQLQARTCIAAIARAWLPGRVDIIGVIVKEQRHFRGKLP